MTVLDGRIIRPGSTIGILGGGQLGRMLVLAGRNMGYRFVTLDPEKDAPCGQVADAQIQAGFEDLNACEALALESDVITYEFENVNHNVTKLLMQKNYVPQGCSLLYITQNRLREKKAIEKAGIKVASYQEIKTHKCLKEALFKFKLPSVLKTTMGGYDGKGQWVIRSSLEVEKAFETLIKNQNELILEEFIDFDKELSVIVARSPRGEMKTFPVSENIHLDNILHQSIVPARVLPSILKRAEEIAFKLAESLGVIGLLAVEMFLTKDGELLVNELAPRPHNSGHFTMEACVTSQFEQHIRAICNLPLGSTQMKSSVVMINVLGKHIIPLLQKIDQPGFLENLELGVSAKVHLYGKAEAKEKRKMGHINLLSKDINKAFLWIDQAGIWKIGKE